MSTYVTIVSTVTSSDETSQAFPCFMCAPLTLRGKPGSEATLGVHVCSNLGVVFLKPFLLTAQGSKASSWLMMNANLSVSRALVAPGTN